MSGESTKGQVSDSTVSTHVMIGPEYDVEFAGVRGRDIRVVAGTRGIWRWRFVCGPREIQPGGSLRLFCEVPKFWLATCVQMESPEKPGFVRAVASPSINVHLTDVQRNWKALAWANVVFPDGLKPGQEVTVEFGSDKHPCFCIAHKYPCAPVCWRIDYAGIGHFFRLWPAIVVRVVPGAAAKIVLVAPSVVGVDESFTVQGRVEDRNSNIGASLNVPIHLELVGTNGNVVERQSGPSEVSTSGIFHSSGWSTIAEGVYRVRATCEELPAAWSNPVCVARRPALRVVWGDCHCHTMWADGVGTLEDNIRFARDEAFLDVFGFTEHLCSDEELTTGAVDKMGADWSLLGPQVAEATRHAHAPEKFVTLLGYEYTPYRIKDKNPRGDFCVFAPSDRWEIMPFARDWGDFCALAERNDCLVIPHVGGRWPMWSEFTFRSGVTPLVEIASMHGHFEGYAQEALQRGLKLGFIGMSDGHFGMPGYDNWAQHGRTPNLKHRNYSVQSAITGFCVPVLTREAVFQAMRERRTYATTGQRILLDFKINDLNMGEEGIVTTPPVLRIVANGTVPIALVDIVRGDRRLQRFNGNGARDMTIELIDPVPMSRETWYYVRVTQEDFSLAWSSPIWVVYQGNEAGKKRALPAWNEGPH